MSWNPNENPNTVLVTALYFDSPTNEWRKCKISVGSRAHKAIQGDPEYADLLMWYKAV